MDLSYFYILTQEAVKNIVLLHRMLMEEKMVFYIYILENDYLMGMINKRGQLSFNGFGGAPEFDPNMVDYKDLLYSFKRND